MSYTSRVKYSASAGQSQFDYPFPYIDQDHIHVSVNGSDRSFSWLTSTRISLQVPASLGDTVVVYRLTPVDSAFSVFSNSAVLTGPDLNLVLTQAFYREQELNDDIIDVAASAGSGGGSGGGGSGSGVTSVNGHTGTVTLGAADVGAAPASHTQAISTITGLQTALDAKAALDSPALTGNPTAPTQSPGNSTTRIATTAFVAAAIAGLGGGGGGSGNMRPKLLSDFGTVDATGATSTDNDAAISTAEAAVDSAVYVDDGNYKSSKALSDFTKAYQGRGKWLLGTSVLPAKLSYMATKPTTPATQGLTGWFDGDQRFTDGGEYHIIGPNVRTFDVDGPAHYYESNTIPHHSWIDVFGGNSGYNAFLTSGAGPGNGTVIPLNAAADASWVGQKVAFANSPDGTIVETRTVTAVNSGGNNIVIDSALANTYTWNPSDPVNGQPCIFFHHRTNASQWYNKMTHAAGGDGIQLVLRNNTNYVPKATEVHTFMAATGANLGGDNYANSDGIYFQNEEWQLQGQSYDVTGISRVVTLSRNNDTSLTGGRFWAGYWMQSTGTRPVDVGFGAIGPYRYGIDFAKATLTETTRLTAATTSGFTVITVADLNGAHPGDPITVGSDTRTISSINVGAKQITLSSSVPAGYPVGTFVSYGKGGAAMNLALGHRIVWNSSASNSGRGGDSLGVFQPFHGNVQGDLLMESGNDGSNDFWQVRFARGANSTTPDTARIKMTPGGTRLYGTNHFITGDVGIQVGSLSMDLSGAAHTLSLAPGVYITMVGGVASITHDNGVTFHAI